jgi:hypothetical protein
MILGVGIRVVICFISEGLVIADHALNPFQIFRGHGSLTFLDELPIAFCKFLNVTHHGGLILLKIRD